MPTREGLREQRDLVAARTARSGAVDANDVSPVHRVRGRDDRRTCGKGWPRKRGGAGEGRDSNGTAQLVHVPTVHPAAGVAGALIWNATERFAVLRRPLLLLDELDRDVRVGSDPLATTRRGERELDQNPEPAPLLEQLLGRGGRLDPQRDLLSGLAL